RRLTSGACADPPTAAPPGHFATLIAATRPTPTRPSLRAARGSDCRTRAANRVRPRARLLRRHPRSVRLALPFNVPFYDSVYGRPGLLFWPPVQAQESRSLDGHGSPSL